MFGGVYVKRTDFWGHGASFVPVTREACGRCGRPDPDIAHVVYEYVAATLADRLRLAVELHLDEHGCHASDCNEAEDLIRLLPAGDVMIIG